MYCSECGKEIPEESEFCPYCGTNLKNETEQVIEEKEKKGNICSSCKKKIPDGSEFCPYCGADLKEIPVSSNMIDGKNNNYIQDSKTVKQPTSKKTIIIIIVIIGIGIAVASYNVWNIYKKANNKLNSFTDKLNISSEKNTVKEENKINKDEVKKTYKEVLNDKDWVKKNLYISKNYFGETISSNKKQTIKYAIIDDDTFTIPVGIAITEYTGDGDCNRCTILTYENGKVKTKIVDTDRVSYSIDKDKKLLFAGSARMGTQRLTVYTINDKGVKKKEVLEEIEEIDENADFYYKYYLNDEEITKSKYLKIYGDYIPEDYEDDGFTILK